MTPPLDAPHRRFDGPRRRRASGVLALLLAAVMVALTACGRQDGAQASGDARPEHPMRLVLAHSLSSGHVTSKALVDFAEQVKKDSGGRIVVELYPDGQLGTEREQLEQLQAGVLDMTRVSAPGLATYADGYHAFGLPFVFSDEKHYHAAMDSPGMHEFFRSTGDDGFIGLTWYTSGARSFYTVDRPIRRPEDLRGLKIRVQDMRSQTEMMRALGGSGVVMPLGDVYTALQTGIVDGAESNETALTQSKHGEVAKVFSEDEHTMIPDMLVMSTRTWNRLSPQDQQLVVDSADASTQRHKKAWAEEVEKARSEARKEGVTFVADVDREAFRQATASLNEQFAGEYPGVRRVLDIISSTRQEQR
ncbi:TRAP transporter substrate-binding protein [Mobilicoccus massiliensis]|uniref:TRAP transporter substrate-binding protein n=1 Tax=Mobilicoccus massiliensis TaxID=1522310 RepID=UPI00069508FC|nr:TRAP transporter substrate-binding protein [Mobilicoccus massiliensis]